MAIAEASAPARYPTLPARGGRLSTWSFREIYTLREFAGVAVFSQIRLPVAEL
jgi:hypothetical protein